MVNIFNVEHHSRSIIAEDTVAKEKTSDLCPGRACADQIGISGRHWYHVPNAILREVLVIL
eukprot:scaffold620391_cov56-Prasinocladus_malaysianus.AAC.1